MSRRAEASAYPNVVAVWDGITYGTLCEGDECSAMLLVSHAAIFADGSWVRTAHDPEDPLRSFHEEGESGGEGVLARYRGYTTLKAVHRS